MLLLFIATVNTMNRIIGWDWEWYTAVIKESARKLKAIRNEELFWTNIN